MVKYILYENIVIIRKKPMCLLFKIFYTNFYPFNISRIFKKILSCEYMTEPHYSEIKIIQTEFHLILKKMKEKKK